MQHIYIVRSSENEPLAYTEKDRAVEFALRIADAAQLRTGNPAITEASRSHLRAFLMVGHTVALAGGGAVSIDTVEVI